MCIISPKVVSGKKELINKTLNLYSNLGLRSIFAKIRFWDAPFIEAEKLVPKKGIIVDLGCGEGLFTNFLAVSSVKRKAIGVEIDKNRLKYAVRGIKNASFRYGDVVNINFPYANAFVLFHLLHHLPSAKAQETVIKKCVSKLKKNGRIIIVEIDPSPTLKYAITWLTDHFIFPIVFGNKLFEPHILYRDIKGWRKLLESSSSSRFNVQVQNAYSNKPFSHIIVIATKT